VPKRRHSAEISADSSELSRTSSFNINQLHRANCWSPDCLVRKVKVKMRAEFPNSGQGDGYARDLWRERHRDLETLESERLDMSASDYQSSRRSLGQAIEELETLLPHHSHAPARAPLGCSGPRKRGISNLICPCRSSFLREGQR
jgi:hypothetical protein